MPTVIENGVVRMVKPNFFIIGAPKCGTTAMSEYLRSHPDVFFSNPKEPHYFSNDLVTKYRVSSESEYLSLFSGASGKKVIGEGSVHYLQSKTALRKIMEFNPSARFVAMVRNPVDLAYSWHSEARYTEGETVKNFMEAWRLQPDRIAGNGIPSGCKDSRLLHYSEVASVGDQLCRAIETVGRDRIKIIIFDDFIHDSRVVYRDVLDFLGLDDDGRDSFPVINDSKIVKSEKMMRLGHFVARTKKRFGITSGTGLLEFLNVSKKKREALPVDFRRELVAHFLPQVEKVEALLGRQLPAWRF